MAIHFRRIDGPFGTLSNHSPHPIEMDGVTWPTAQHHFQAMKFPHEPERQERIRAAATPGEAKRIGREAGATPREDWDDVRDEVMLAAVRAKFVQNPEARRVLLSTGDEELVEHSPRDAYWGDGGDGSGLNKLGWALMLVRAELRVLAADTRFFSGPSGLGGPEEDGPSSMSDVAILDWVQENYHWDGERTDVGGVDWEGIYRFGGDGSELRFVDLEDEPDADDDDDPPHTTE